MIELQTNPQNINAGKFIEQNVKDLEHGITKVELMKCEMLRLNSFKHRPYETYRGVWPSQLVKAGFYFDPRTSETVCYWCCIRIPASRWEKGTNPFAVHLRQSPDCEYITGQCKENIPFHTESQVTNKLFYLEPSPGSSASRRPISQGRTVVADSDGIPSTLPLVQLSSDSLEADHPNEVANSVRNTSSNISTNSTPPSLRYQNRNNSAPASLPYQSGGVSSRDNRTRTREMFHGDSPDPLQHMKSEEARLMTFIRWPNHAAVSPEELARAGFFYTGSTDRVQCAFCENVLRNWEPGDNPSFEHRRHFPRCRFILGHDVGNVQIPTAQRQRVQVSDHPVKPVIKATFHAQ